ncbi:MAG: penicillin acylase family protein, partial [Sphingomonadales bacterium]|nr:penicillin acylase family protein [Sphingomonadales bacterium]
AGINAWFAANPESGSAERRRMLPVMPEDVIGHTQRTINLFFMAGGELGQIRRLLAAAESIEDAEPGERGSNAWAIAPSRSASGEALLLMNPHLPWDGVFTWFEAHLTAPGLNAYGVGLLGQGFTSILFNEHLGWTHTVNEHDGADIYAVPLTDGGYLFGEEVRGFEESEATLKVRGEDGTLEERAVPLRRSVHGPVLGMTEDTAYALRIAGLADPRYAQAFAQYDAMARADNREEWEAAFDDLQLPTFNAIYADDNGEILYVSSGLHPVRPRGDAGFWGESIDGGDPELLWSDYQPYDRLLRVANPASGFVQNSNETGWTATIPPALDPAEYPADYVAPTMRSRPQHGLQMLLGDESIGYDELIDYAHSTRLALADNVLDDLIAAARADRRPVAMRAADVLAGWNRRSDADSRGAVLFAHWGFAMERGESGIAYDAPWTFDDPTRWPEGLADDEAAVDALVAAAERLEAAGAPLDVAWGEMARVPDGEGGSLPTSLGLSGLGAFRVGNFAPREEGVAFDFDGGTGWVAAVEFGETPRARAILPYGNFAERPDGVRDQLPLFSRGELREVNFTPAVIEAATVRRESLDYGSE